jgi:hypothetical protein
LRKWLYAKAKSTLLIPYFALLPVLTMNKALRLSTCSPCTALFPCMRKACEAADIITAHPVALQLRTLQTMAEIATEKNSTIIFPAQFMTTVQEALAILQKDSQSK